MAAAIAAADEKAHAVSAAPSDDLTATTKATVNEVVAIGDGKASREEKMTAACEQLIEGMGEDVSRDGLIKTPSRMAKALLECTSGYTLDPVAILQSALFDVEAGGGMVVVRDVEFHSLCEHHVLPFFGKVHIAYIPTSKVVGLSKFARAVDALAKRLQVQERITRQLAEAIQTAAGTEDVAIITEAEHMCMSMRGASKPGSRTQCVVHFGRFKTDSSLRLELQQMLCR